MAYRLEFYRAPRGDEPALDYVRAQTKGQRAMIGRALRYLEEFGHALRRPAAEYLGEGLYELRVRSQGLQHRLIYFFHQKRVIVVTSGFLKNEARVSPEEFMRAGRRRRDWIARLGGAA